MIKNLALVALGAKTISDAGQAAAVNTELLELANHIGLMSHSKYDEKRIDIVATRVTLEESQLDRFVQSGLCALSGINRFAVKSDGRVHPVMEAGQDLDVKFKPAFMASHYAAEHLSVVFPSSVADADVLIDGAPVAASRILGHSTGFSEVILDLTKERSLSFNVDVEVKDISFNGTRYDVADSSVSYPSFDNGVGIQVNAVSLDVESNAAYDTVDRVVEVSMDPELSVVASLMEVAVSDVSEAHSMKIVIGNQANLQLDFSGAVSGKAMIMVPCLPLVDAFDINIGTYQDATLAARAGAHSSTVAIRNIHKGRYDV